MTAAHFFVAGAVYGLLVYGLVSWAVEAINARRRRRGTELDALRRLYEDRSPWMGQGSGR